MNDVRIGSAAYGAAFAPDALEQARIANSVKISSYVQKRLDLRSKPTFAFCGSQNGQSDCAYSIEEHRDGYLLAMHLIDADEFVCKGSPLDNAAAERFASFREPSGKHTTMLPQEIYDGVCSFQPGTDRLAISILMYISHNGKLQKFSADRSIVHNTLCCSYNEVDALYAQSDRSVVLPLREKYAVALNSFDLFYALGGVLFAARLDNGCPDITPIRTVCDFDENGKPVGIRRVDDWDIGRVMREFMIFASTSIGELLHNRGIPAIYTCRDALSSETLGYLARISQFDGSLEGDNEAVQRRIAEHIKLSPHSELLSAEFSTHSQPVYYQTEPGRNCALGSSNYVRFAHPAHNYPDLTMQRILKHCIDAGFEQAELNIGKMKRWLAELVPAFTKQQIVREERWFELLHGYEKQLLLKDAVFDAAYIGGDDCKILLPWGLIADYKPGDNEVCDFQSITVNGERKPLLAHLIVKVCDPNVPLFCST